MCTSSLTIYCSLFTCYLRENWGLVTDSRTPVCFPNPARFPRLWFCVLPQDRKVCIRLLISAWTVHESFPLGAFPSPRVIPDVINCRVGSATVLVALKAIWWASEGVGGYILMFQWWLSARGGLWPPLPLCSGLSTGFADLGALRWTACDHNSDFDGTIWFILDYRSCSKYPFLLYRGSPTIK